ncbi:diaminopimelate decarboxylase [Desulfocucumis palustris]|uniref:Diaminopimelate decarboxylase n=1 Tax=Desulfocucumis palustris TaxID=1898651 RepID=A0A2L2XMR2_9FIRM|nr:diaminopimelate decarboxylase [Desulfocucumis palustris]GBF35241.1 diaminopimelate decarboxylase [Desulfocucumis palustris]
MINLTVDHKKIKELADLYGTPLYVYDENTIRLRCREMKNLLPYENFRVNYSAKANSNMEILKIILDEGIDVDAMSPGEIYIEQKAGFPGDRIFFVCNNVSAEEMLYAIERDILISVDSLSQLELYGKKKPGGRIAVRFNPGYGSGHSDKVITGGESTKFGIQKIYINAVKEILRKYSLELAGINQHIGSFILEEDNYIEGCMKLLEIAGEFSGLSFIDFGGGFGIPYNGDESKLNLTQLSIKLMNLIESFIREYDNKNITFKIEPGRYIVAESGFLLGRVNAVKYNYEKKYVGTDLGFNVLIRPVLYDSYHEIKIVKRDNVDSHEKEQVNIVGNICESGDIIARDRLLPRAEEGDLVVVCCAGAYGFSMSSNYNCRLRPAEVLICSDGTHRLIRRRETLEDLVKHFPGSGPAY